MTDRAEQVFLFELGRQCDFVERSNQALGTLLNEFLGRPMEDFVQMSSEERLGYQIEIFRTLHSLLTHSAMVSKLLWPPKNRDKVRWRRAKHRGAHLRRLLNVPDDHPIRSRTLRDHLEHLDERLDSWAHGTEGTNLVYDFIGPASSHRDWSSEGHMRWFDPYSGSYLFRGETYDLNDIVDGVRSIRAKLVEHRRSRRAP